MQNNDARRLLFTVSKVRVSENKWEQNDEPDSSSRHLHPFFVGEKEKTQIPSSRQSGVQQYDMHASEAGGRTRREDTTEKTAALPQARIFGGPGGKQFPGGCTSYTLGRHA